MSATGELITFIDSYLAFDPFLFQPERFWENPRLAALLVSFWLTFIFPALYEKHPKQLRTSR